MTAAQRRQQVSATLACETDGQKAYLELRTDAMRLTAASVIIGATDLNDPEDVMVCIGLLRSLLATPAL